MNENTEKVVSLNLQEINLDDVSNDTVDVFSLDNKQNVSSNLGEGVELLMNDRMKNNKNNEPTVTTIQQELNDITELNNAVIDDSVKPVVGEVNHDYKDKGSFVNKPIIGIAKGTSKMDDISESWDGFKDVNHMNIESSASIKKSEQDLLREKFEVLRKLETLEEKGANLSKKYSMEHDLEEMKGEYEYLINEKEKKNSIKFQGKVLTTMITGLEFLNSKFDPFDVKLDGWSEQVNENVDDFDEIFAELHEKYKSKAKMAPEIKLLFQLASSGIMIHMTNTMFKSALPGMDDIMRQNPDLMNQFTTAAMSSMEQSQPGLSNFMNDFSNQKETRRPNFETPKHRKQEESVNISNQNSSMREEMKGPVSANIDSILANLDQNKNITVQNDSIISADEINSLSGKKKRRNNSNKNTISLAI